MFKIFNRESFHKIYLFLCSIIVSYGVFLGLIEDGTFQLLSLRMYTYQSNLLMVVGYIVIIALYDKESPIKYYISSSVLLAVIVTGLVYNFVLVPFNGNSVFYSSLENFLTHFLAPILALFNYLFFEQKGKLNFNNILVGMAYPAVYWLIFVSIGGFINFYPYFFMDPNSVGWPMLFVWFALLLSIFFVLGYFLVSYDRIVSLNARTRTKTI